MKKPKPLRLFAEDAKGLEIISSMTQDAIAKIQGFSYDKTQRRFSVEVNRFHWEISAKRKPYFRSRSLVSVDSVLSVRAKNLPAASSDEVVNLLSVTFDQNAEENPDGKLRLVFSQGGEVEVNVECIDVSLVDSDSSWPTIKKPKHKSI